MLTTRPRALDREGASATSIHVVLSPVSVSVPPSHGAPPLCHAAVGVRPRPMSSSSLYGAPRLRHAAVGVGPRPMSSSSLYRALPSRTRRSGQGPGSLRNRLDAKADPERRCRSTGREIRKVQIHCASREQTPQPAESHEVEMVILDSNVVNSTESDHRSYRALRDPNLVEDRTSTNPLFNAK